MIWYFCCSKNRLTVPFYRAHPHQNVWHRGSCGGGGGVRTYLYFLCITIKANVLLLLLIWHIDEFKFKVLLFILCTLVFFWREEEGKTALPYVFSIISLRFENILHSFKHFKIHVCDDQLKRRWPVSNASLIYLKKCLLRTHHIAVFHSRWVKAQTKVSGVFFSTLKSVKCRILVNMYSPSFHRFMPNISAPKIPDGEKVDFDVSRP